MSLFNGFSKSLKKKKVHLETPLLCANHNAKNDQEPNTYNYQKHPSNSVDLGSTCDTFK